MDGPATQAKLSQAYQWVKRALPFIAFAIFIAVLILAHHILKKYSYHEIKDSISAIPIKLRITAIGTTFLAYGILSTYDLLAFRYIRKPLAPIKILLTAFTAFAFSNNIGLANLAGSTIRLRIYSGYGIKPADIVKIIAFIGLSFWLGFAVLAGSMLSISPLQLPEAYGISSTLSRVIGAVLLTAAATYFTLTLTRKKPIELLGVSFRLPSFRLGILQVMVASMDWSLAALTLYILLPPMQLTFAQFLTVFLSVQMIALIAHVPGGIGILEAMIIYFVGPDHQPTPAILGSLLAFRAIFYFIPLVTAAAFFAGFEIVSNRHAVSDFSQSALQWTKGLTPNISALLVFIAGSVLLFSGAAPNDHGRLLEMSNLVPLSAIEFSHFIASSVGIALLILARGLLERSNGAWYMTTVLLLIGVITSLINGFQFEQALILLLFAILLIGGRGEFDQNSRLLAEPFSATWTLSILGVLLGSLWIGVFAFQHVEYRDELWWRFTLNGDAPRFLRASLGAIATGTALCLMHLLRVMR